MDVRIDAWTDTRMDGRTGRYRVEYKGRRTDRQIWSDGQSTALFSKHIKHTRAMNAANAVYATNVFGPMVS